LDNPTRNPDGLNGKHPGCRRGAVEVRGDQIGLPSRGADLSHDRVATLLVAVPDP
jgi:hypothetical protein